MPITRQLRRCRISLLQCCSSPWFPLDSTVTIGYGPIIKVKGNQTLLFFFVLNLRFGLGIQLAVWLSLGLGLNSNIFLNRLGL